MSRIGKAIGSTLLAGTLATGCVGVIATSNEPVNVNVTAPVPNGGGYIAGGVIAPYGPGTYYYSSGPPVVYFNSGAPYYYGWGPNVNFNYGHGHGGYDRGHTTYRQSNPSPFCPPAPHRQQRR